MRKLWKRIGVAFLGIVILFFLLLLIEHVRGAVSLAAYKKELAKRGETLDIEKFRVAPPPDSENGLPDVLKLEKLLQKGKVIPGSPPPKMKLLGSGKAEIGFVQEFWVEDKVTNTWADVESDLKQNAEFLANIREALRKPSFNANINYSNGFDIPLEHLSKTKVLSQWLGTSMQNSLRHGNSDAAMANLVAAVTAVRLAEDDRLAISELVRIAISSIDFTTTWEALQTNVWSDQQLARLQQVWATNTFAENMVHALEMERAVGDLYYARFSRSNEEAYRSLFWPELSNLDEEDAEAKSWFKSEFFRKQVYCRIWRFSWREQAEKFYLQGMQRMIRDQRSGAEKAANPPRENWIGLAGAPDQKFYDRWRFGSEANSLASLSLATLKADQAETQRSLVLCAIALRRYELRNGKLPVELGALVPQFLTSIPLDYMDRKPIRYRVNASGKWTLYSVGKNGIDDQGDASPLETQRTLYGIWKGKDAVWPEPARE